MALTSASSTLAHRRWPRGREHHLRCEPLPLIRGAASSFASSPSNSAASPTPEWLQSHLHSHLHPPAVHLHHPPLQELPSAPCAAPFPVPPRSASP